MQVLVLGAGQLARMMALAGAPLNIDVSAYDVRSENVIHPLTLAFIEADLEKAISQADVITAEFEHIPADILTICEKSGKFLPNPEAIRAGGDRRVEKALLDASGVRNAKYHIISQRADLDTAIQHIGLPLVLKTALGGYDGKGQWRLKSVDQADSIWQEMAESLKSTEHQAVVAEQMIPFEREVSLIGVRNQQGDIKAYPLTENTHFDGVLSVSRALPEHALQQQATDMFKAIAENLNYVGVLALEFFELDGKLLVNEIAPRVHNSGHWTQQGAEVCQFENHLRAVCGLPLGSTDLIRPTAMVNILGQDSLPEQLLSLDSGHIHWYGKEKRPGRKMGHINICAANEQQLSERLLTLSKWLDKDGFPGLHVALNQ